MSQDRPVRTARLEELLASLEKTIAELAGGTAPLEELVAAHQRALRLLAEAQAKLDELKEKADDLAQKLT
ncbi:MAG TPA: exodeoxyribonuclease VII small subunit [Candidatus Eisenbacteria bacterium]|nr:exodeoxyribonuclease VII small subunit [Candidatus Eisenbacteria bacterium]